MVLGVTTRVRACMQMAASAAGKEWRGHVEQTKKHEEAIQAALPVTTTQLALIGTEVGLQDTICLACWQYLQHAATRTKRMVRGTLVLLFLKPVSS